MLMPPVREYGGHRHTFIAPKIRMSVHEGDPDLACVFQCPNRLPAEPVNVLGLSRLYTEARLSEPPGQVGVITGTVPTRTEDHAGQTGTS